MFNREWGKFNGYSSTEHKSPILSELGLSKHNSKDIIFDVPDSDTSSESSSNRSPIITASLSNNPFQVNTPTASQSSSLNSSSSNESTSTVREHSLKILIKKELY